MEHENQTTHRRDLAQGPDSLLTEQVFKKIAELVGLDSVGPDDDFFELGGDSLGAVELVMWAEQLIGRPIATPALFGHPTPRSLTDYLSGLQADDQALSQDAGTFGWDGGSAPKVSSTESHPEGE